MSALFNQETATIRGIPAQDGREARILVNDTELDIVHTQQLFGVNWVGFSWGYSGGGPTFAAMAVSDALFLNHYLAQQLIRLVEEDFILTWPPDKPFQQEINLVDFWQNHRNEIEQAKERAIVVEEQAKTDEKFRLLMKQYDHLNPKKITEKSLLYTLIGPSAETHWLRFSTIVGEMRVRVDVYRHAKTLIYTDVGEYGVQPHFETIAQHTCNKLGIDPASFTFLQRYNFAPVLLHQVSFTYNKSENEFSNPHWNNLTQCAYEQLIKSAETKERQATWEKLFTTTVIETQLIGSGMILKYSIGKQSFNLIDRLDMGFSLCISTVLTLEVAYAICWQFIKHAPSSTALAPYFRQTFGTSLDNVDGFVIKIRPIDFLLQHRKILIDSGYPEAKQLNLKML